jgi:hypothetical protein
MPFKVRLYAHTNQSSLTHAKSDLGKCSVKMVCLSSKEWSHILQSVPDCNHQYMALFQQDVCAINDEGMNLAMVYL